MNDRNVRRLAAVWLVLAVCLGSLSGCGGAAPPAAQDTPPAVEPPGPEEAAEPSAIAEAAGNSVDALPDAFPQTFTFLSGAGAWRTYLTLEQDGSFAGEFTDWNAGSDPAYPHGFYDISTFTGRFGALRQLDETTYALTLEEVILQEEPGTQWAADGTRYTAADPYGLEAGTAFTLYAPETPTAGLDEAFLAWWPGDGLPKTLECWGLWNRETGYGFYTYYQY